MVGLSVLELLIDLHDLRALHQIKVVFHYWLKKNLQNLRKWRNWL